MEHLSEALLLEILSRLDDPADVARCRLAWKTFDKLSADLRSLNLQWPLQRYIDSRSRISNPSSSSQFTFKKIFLKLVLNLRAVESVRIGAENLPLDLSNDDLEDNADDLYLTDTDFVKEWLPRVSEKLKSLSISDFWVQSCWRQSNVLSVISAYCHNLLELELKNARLSVANLKLMPMLTSLTFEFIQLDDKNLTELNKSFPNLQVLNLIDVRGLKLPMIQLPNLITCHWTITDAPQSLTLITPKLIMLILECLELAALYIEAPLLSHFHLALDHVRKFTAKPFENLKTLWLESFHILSILVNFPLTETVVNLTLDSRLFPDVYTKFTLEKLFSVFPSVTSLCFNEETWEECQDFNNHFGWKALDSAKGLKRFRGYFFRVEPLSTFSLISCVMDQCVNLEDVSLLIHRDETAKASEYFIYWCMACWPKVNWRWGIWEEGKEDSWITVDPNAYKCEPTIEEE